MPELMRYNAACRALAAARNVDEVKDVRDKAVAIRAYAKQAKNRNMETDAIEIRVRAERRLGEMLAAGPKNTGTKGQLKGRHSSGGAKREPPEKSVVTITELGVSKKLSARARKAAAMPDEEFEGKLADWRGRVEANEDGAIPGDPMAAKPHVAHNSGDNEWYTPTEYIEAARKVMGSIDLDPASTDEANAVVKAAKFYTAEQDGLVRTWKGNIWLNPPFGSELIGRFAQKMVESIEVVQAIVLVNNATETRWFQLLLTKTTCLCFPASRIKFWHPRKVATPLQGQAIIGIGVNEEKFRAEFKCFGSICRILH
jgi:hypothetical protein